jgi:hypothetical protein
MTSRPDEVDDTVRAIRTGAGRRLSTYSLTLYNSTFVRMNLVANKKVFYSGILLFGLLAMTARNATDPDLWWHLRTGQWIVENHSVPHADPFSFTRAGQPWISHEWLSDLLFYGLWRLGGFGALIVFASVVTAAGFLFLYWRCPGRPSWAAAATVLGAWAAAPCWGVRPQMFTFTLTSILLWILERSEERPRLLGFIPPLFLLWLNLHAGFALGLALILLYATGLAIEGAVGTTSWTFARPITGRTVLVGAACLALVPLNPNGFLLYRYPFDTLRSEGMRSFIVEWFSPDFHQGLYAPLLLVLLLLIATLALSQSKIKGRVLIPLVFTAFAGLDAVRHIPIFVLLAIPVICLALPSESPIGLPRHPAPDRFRPSFRVAAVVLLASFALLRWQILTRNQQEREAQLQPEGAFAYLQSTNQPARAFVYYDWGGYAIWRLYPKYRVFVDGRADLYDNGILRQFRTVIELHRGWQAVLNDAAVGTLVVPVTSAVTQALVLDREWSNPYRDSQAVVFVRKPTSADPMPSETLKRP